MVRLAAGIAMTDPRLPPDFDPATYLVLNPDVAAAGVDAALHYLTFGIAENRRYRDTDHWNKMHLLGVLSAALGLTRYLELTTNLTGQRHVEARILRFPLSRRLVYRLTGPVYDRLPVHYASPDDDISGCLEQIAEAGERFDLIFVDSHHTYACSIRDLRAAVALLLPGGVIVVHDCNPLTRELAAPDFLPGAWNGESYRALIDLCLGNPRLDYFTIDIDEGCAVIMKPRGPLQAARNLVRAVRQRPLLQRWKTRATGPGPAFDMFEAERAALLRIGGFPYLRYKLSGVK
jgi:hypothetical protein